MASHGVRSAGIVRCWRGPVADPGHGAVEVALVHRPRYGDWSLPKGKLRHGEHPLVTACREAAEETGVRAAAGRRLEVSHYDPGAGCMAVEYCTGRSPNPGRLR